MAIKRRGTYIELTSDLLVDYAYDFKEFGGQGERTGVENNTIVSSHTKSYLESAEDEYTVKIWMDNKEETIELFEVIK